MSESCLSHLECSCCGTHFPAGELHTFCQTCRAPLLARYDLASARPILDRDQFLARPKGMWRWQELLPVRQPENRLTLGEGDTPLLDIPRVGERLGLSKVLVKEEGVNPTGSFKARGLAAAVSMAKELGVTRLIIPTAGNAGGALAAYAARGGLQAHIFMPEDTPNANVHESRITGAQVTWVPGLISDAARAAAALAQQEPGWFDVSTFKEPYRVEGKKIMGYELAESLGWRLPDVIIYPTGGGTGLVGMWKAFEELEALGWLEDTRRPRMVVVQAHGCAPVVRAFEARAHTCEFWEGAHTIASGLRVPLSFADRLIMDCIYESRGTAVAVSDSAILQAQHLLAQAEGLFVAPEAAATLAALEGLVRSGWVGPDEQVVLFSTGMGLKYI
jgi:threonine synthase